MIYFKYMNNNKEKMQVKSIYKNMLLKEYKKMVLLLLIKLIN